MELVLCESALQCGCNTSTIFSIRCPFQPSPHLISNRTVLDSMYCCWSAALRSRGDKEGYGMGVVFRDHQK